MSVETLKTRAEQALDTMFAAMADSLPGDAQVKSVRSAAIEQFRATGLPHRRVEAYKYTDLRAGMPDAHPMPSTSVTQVDDAAIDEALGPLATLDAERVVVLDGKIVAHAPLEGMELKSVGEALEDACFSADHTDLAARTGNDAVVALNTAFMRDGVALHIPTSREKPIHIIHAVTASAPAAVVSRNVFYLAEDAEATVIESFVTLGDADVQTNTLSHVGIGARGKLHHVKVQQENDASVHLGNWVVNIAEEAKYRGFQMTTGAALSRTQTFVEFAGKDAEAHVNGAFLLRGKQHCDMTMVIDHAVPSCTSREFIKGVLDDTARGVFQGKVQVRQVAQKTDGKQMSQALLLSERAEFDAKPELEIFADDVVCGHGATTGRIDDEHLFYLMARGVPQSEARRLLIQAFVGEAIETIENEALVDALTQVAATWMAKG